jgi:hypothetical protein
VWCVFYPKWSLSPLLFKFALDYSIRKVQENLVGLKLNGTHRLLVYANDVNLSGYKIHAIKNKGELSLTLVRRLF